MKELITLGHYEGPTDSLRVEILINENNKTLTVRDNGIGMTVEEVKHYINQIAFSGATEFVKKYKDKTDQNQLIGHFGLGFYSAFMVADKVEICTKSYQANASAVHWSCDGSTNFEIRSIEKEEVGTEVKLHLRNDAEEFLKKNVSCPF